MCESEYRLIRIFVPCIVVMASIVGGLVVVNSAVVAGEVVVNSTVVTSLVCAAVVVSVDAKIFYNILFSVYVSALISGQ